ncbi:GNAT family N-acetyltransferase [Cytobacillus sp. IB215665]|uniref:GNAT family N-acetyltransferase n=1 Tax=Cytobacillus sp. IB215665 TaxID=3097357 RepID=UPI002A13D723|nr:GNAT family N-acetyltransferase [Cytobacillus sp. IB215665]MDX8365621.1 GNAT family N-acetyltransferase [Cytobacillus sp. IB215665]
MNSNSKILHCINVRPITMTDYNSVLYWSKDESFCLANGWEYNQNSKKLYQWWLNCVNRKSEEFVRLGITLHERLIGYADLANINNNTAELGIAIGESALWGKGIGFYSAECMMQYGFEELGITVFNAETHEANVRSKKMLGKLGFKEISRVGNEEYLGTTGQLIQYRLFHKN